MFDAIPVGSTDYGTKLPPAPDRSMSAFEGKAAVRNQLPDVRF